MEWFDVNNKLPDADETVLLYMPDADGEKVWPGYFSWLENADWLLADGMPAGRVTHWGLFPDGPGKLEQIPELKAALRALKEAQEAADFNFEQYQDAGAELCKLGEQMDDLLTALHELACLGNGDQYGNSIGNCIAQDAIAKVKRRAE